VSSGLALGIVTIILFKLGSTTALLLCSAVVALTSLELFGVLRRAGYRPATLVGLLGAVGLTVGAYLRGENAYPLVMALVFVFSLLWYLFKVEHARPVVNVAATLLGFVWVGVLGSFAGLLLDPRLFPNRDGVAFVFGAVIVTVAYDIAAYVAGGRWGRHPMAPSISPAKTWEGLTGGTVAALLVAALVVSQIHPWNLNRAIALGVVVAVLAPLGDLCESLLKRDLGLKDMGSLVPGHGGLFDRVDSLLFVLPATYCLLRLLNVT
jgi:CDP-diglyceride synthetase